MVDLYEREFQEGIQFKPFATFGRWVRDQIGDENVQRIKNFDAVLGSLRDAISNEDRRMSDDDAKRLKNLRLGISDVGATAFAKLSFVLQSLERTYLTANQPVPKDLTNLKICLGVPTVVVSPDPNQPLSQAINPQTAQAAPETTREAPKGFRTLSSGVQVRTRVKQ
jgi:hypothetical protein